MCAPYSVTETKVETMSGQSWLLRGDLQRWPSPPSTGVFPEHALHFSSAAVLSRARLYLAPRLECSDLGCRARSSGTTAQPFSPLPQQQHYCPGGPGPRTCLYPPAHPRRDGSQLKGQGALLHQAPSGHKHLGLGHTAGGSWAFGFWPLPL